MPTSSSGVICVTRLASSAPVSVPEPHTPEGVCACPVLPALPTRVAATTTVAAPDASTRRRVRPRGRFRNDGTGTGAGSLMAAFSPSRMSRVCGGVVSRALARVSKTSGVCAGAIAPWSWGWRWLAGMPGIAGIVGIPGAGGPGVTAQRHEASYEIRRSKPRHDCYVSATAALSDHTRRYHSSIGVAEKMSKLGHPAPLARRRAVFGAGRRLRSAAESRLR